MHRKGAETLTINLKYLNKATTVETLIWNTSIQRTPPFESRGHQIWSRKNVVIIFVSRLPLQSTLSKTDTFGTGTKCPS